LALSSHYVLTMLTTLQYELIGWLWTKKWDYNRFNRWF
jgi:hypothetical protein